MSFTVPANIFAQMQLVLAGYHKDPVTLKPLLPWAIVRWLDEAHRKDWLESGDDTKFKTVDSIKWRVDLMSLKEQLEFLETGVLLPAKPVTLDTFKDDDDEAPPVDTLQDHSVTLQTDINPGLYPLQHKAVTVRRVSGRRRAPPKRFGFGQ